MRLSAKHLLAPALGIFLALGCSSSSTEAGPCEKTQNGSACRSDGDCCSGSCRWQGGGYCQSANLDPPPCQAEGSGCTQGAHCCSGVCGEGDVCVGQLPPSTGNMAGDAGPSAGGCKGPGSGCGTGRECCTGACQDGRCAGGNGGGGGGGGGGGDPSNCVPVGQSCIAGAAQCCRGALCRNGRCG